MDTVWYLTRRVLQALVVILLVTVVVFCLLHALPGGPARGILGPQATAQQIAAFNHEQGLDRPLPVQYVHYLGTLLHGDLGTSYTLNEAVSRLITQRLPKTLVLTVLSALVGLLLAVPLGMWQAVRRNRPVDYVVTTLSFVAYSTPVYFLGLLLILLFTQVLNWFPSQAPQGTRWGRCSRIRWGWCCRWRRGRRRWWRCSAGTCGLRRWRTSPRTTSARPGRVDPGRTRFSSGMCSGIR